MKNRKISIDGNTAAAYVAYALSEVAAVYPITPSTTMAELCDEWAAKNKKNIFDNTVKIVEMQSEGGAAGAMHGTLAVGALSTTFTASQGLLLMIPNIYKIAGELLPAVIHVSARTVAGHALNIFGDHSDVMACRQTGACMIASNNVQEAMDMACISHIASLKASLPFIHFFDGFRTSHEISKIEEIPYETLKELFPIKAMNEFKANAHNPMHPKQTGTAQNADVFFQNKEAANQKYNEVYDIVNDAMIELGKKTSRNYKPFEYYGAKDATEVIVIMGSGADTVEETIDYLATKKEKNGLLKVRLYRPFNGAEFVKSLPATVKNITVLDRTKEPGSIGEPLFLDVVMALKLNGMDKIAVYGGRYGLGGKDFVPKNVVSIYQNMRAAKPFKLFTVNINDDVTNLSLPDPKNFDALENDYYECKFIGLGSDGTISANKSSIKIIGENTDKFVQGYFEYDSKKSGGLTISHLRTSDHPIRSPYLLQHSNFIAIHNYSFINKYDLLQGLKPNSNVLINTHYSQEELGKLLPESFKKQLKDTNSKLFAIDAVKVAMAAGLKNRINVIMQSCFFKISQVIDYKLAEKCMKDFAIKAYGKKGEKVIESNMKAIDAATNDLREISVTAICAIKSVASKNDRIFSKYYEKCILPIEQRRGDEMKVSQFDANGTVPTGTSMYEKRGIGTIAPKWVPENCIQCGQCVFVCPHAAIRSFLVPKDEMSKAPASFVGKPALGVPGADFRVQVSPYDCTGCEICSKICPAKNKALVMAPADEMIAAEAQNFQFATKVKTAKNPFPVASVKGIQFEKPYFEFSGACSGCGETPYIKLITQLFGNSMVVANATGCSSIYSGSSPTCPYTVNENNEGPSWANSLFEDNAEFGYGMKIAMNYRRADAYRLLENLSKADISNELKTAIKKMETSKETSASGLDAKLLTIALENELKTNASVKNEITQLLTYKDLFATRSIWIIGGDGWAYDIDYGGLDHVLASGENVNILVLDTEVYSNTGGQSSKSTPLGSVAKLAANGKQTRKKDLGVMAMVYKNVYVAQIAMGADQTQTIRAINEAQSYDGPSLIIAYAPCINHGLDMSGAQSEMKKAVDAGYWSLYRYDPRKIESPLTIDSKEPTSNYQEFLKGEARYASLFRKDPDAASKLFDLAAVQAKERLDMLKLFSKK